MARCLRIVAGGTDGGIARSQRAGYFLNNTLMFLWLQKVATPAVVCEGPVRGSSRFASWLHFSHPIAAATVNGAETALPEDAPDGDCRAGGSGGVSGWGVTKMIDTSGRFAKGFDTSEAYSLLELCINANNLGEPGYIWHADDWTPMYPAVATNPAQVIGPWDNAWRLWQSHTAPDTYAIVIRGTIEKSSSILEDLVTTSISAQQAVIKAWADSAAGKGGYVSFKLADAAKSEAHLGFTFGLAVLMFARDTGILSTLRDRVPAGSKLLITGHSQGAAIATLTHAFLHYAINDPADRYALRGSGYSLKSYVFAQPKPGNWQFALDFARVAGSRGTAFTVNNSCDWVAQVPLSIEFLDEPGEDLVNAINASAAPPLMKAAYKTFTDAVRVTPALRSISARQNEKFTEGRLQDWNKGPNAMDRTYWSAMAPTAPSSSSINYALAGNSVPVFGNPPGTPGQPVDDPFYQHHLPTYRDLMHAQLDAPVE